MTSARRLAPPGHQWTDDNGNVLDSGLIYTYITGTTTNKATYGDADRGSTLPNPVVLDADGRKDIWLAQDGAYRIVIKDADGNQVASTMDDVVGIVDNQGYTKFDEVLSLNKGNDVASAGSLDLTSSDEAGGSATGNYIDITGTTTINTLGSAEAGDFRILQFDGALTLTHSASLILPGGSSITTAAGDVGIFICEGSGVWRCIGGTGDFTGATGNYPTGYMHGLNVWPDTDADHDAEIRTGACRDFADAQNISLTTNLTKRIDANWSAGDGNGGFPSALTLTADTVYHLFLIKDSATGTVDAGWDSSQTAANLLSDSGYDAYRLIGSQLMDGSANINNRWIKSSGWTMLKTPELLYDSSSITTTATSVSTTSGLNIALNNISHIDQWLLNVYVSHGSAQALVYINDDNRIDDDAPSATAAPLATIATGASGAANSMQLALNVVEYSANANWSIRSNQTSTTVKITLLGFRQLRNTTTLS